MTSTSGIETKTVRFADDTEARSNIWIYEAYSTDVLWFTSKQQDETRRRARTEAREIRARGLDTLLIDTFTTTDTAKSVQRSLNEYTKSKSNPRGLERFISRNNCDVRREHKLHAIKAIVMAQAEGKTRGYELDELTDQLRLLSIQFSIHAKIFARRMGKADAACCNSHKSKKAATASMICAKQPSPLVRPPLQSRNSSSSSLSLSQHSKLSQRQLFASLA